MLNLFMFIYCEAMLILFADTNRMLNKSSLRFYLGTGGPREDEGLGRGPRSKEG